MTLFKAAQIWAIRTLYDYHKALNYFDDILLPTGIDKTSVAYNIFMNCGDMETVVNNSIAFKVVIEEFFKQNFYKYEKLINSTKLEYKPLEDYRTTTDAVTDKNYLKDNTGTQHNKTEGTEKGDVSAFNELDDTYTNADRSRVDMSTLRTDNLNEKFGGTDIFDETKHGTTRDTYQELILQERQVADFNIYTIITNDFKRELLVAIY